MNIIYIGGNDRSGTTLVERYINNQHQIFCLGEVKHLISGNMKSSDICGCSVLLAECEIWSLIWNEARDWSRLRLPRLRDIGGNTHVIEELRYRYMRIIRVLAHLGIETIVDSSKSPQFFKLVIMGINFDKIQVIHVQRHFGGVYHSMRKKIRKPERDDEFMNRHSLLYAFMIWFVSNLKTRQLRNIDNIFYNKLSYEAFCQDPLLSYSEINIGSKFSNNIKVNLQYTYHSVSGNPMRFNQTELKIREDNEWKKTRSGADILALKLLNALLK